jgi:hypothetical protein
VHVVRHDRARARPHRAGTVGLLAAGALAVAVIAYPWSTGYRPQHGRVVQSPSTPDAGGPG